MRATDDAIRLLVLSAHALGTRGCIVIHHTKCGLHNTTNEAIQARVSEATGADASRIDFLPFADLEQSVRDDMSVLRANDLLPQDYLLGFTYDVDTVADACRGLTGLGWGLGPTPLPREGGGGPEASETLSA